MKIATMREKTVNELQAEHINLLRELFNLRMQKASGQFGRGHEIKRVRKNIARVLTIISEKMGSPA